MVGLAFVCVGLWVLGFVVWFVLQGKSRWQDIRTVDHSTTKYNAYEPKWVTRVHREQEIDFRTGKRADGRNE